MEDVRESIDAAKLNFNNLQWKFEAYYKTNAYLIQVEPKRREIIVFIPDKQMTLIADVAPYINMKKLVVGRTYEMEFIIYSASISKKLRKMIIKAVEAPYLADTSEYRRAYNISKLKPLKQFFIRVPKIYRFELIKVIDHFYSKIVRNRFEYSVLRSFKARTKYRWRHLLGF